MTIRAAAWVGMVLGLSAVLTLPAMADLPEAFPITTDNLIVVGMAPTEVAEFDPLLVDYPAPVAVVMAKAVTTTGTNLLDEVLQTKHSVGIYQYHAGLRRWMPMWEQVTGELSIAFVEGYEILDVTGNGSPELAVRIRYSGPERVLDYVVKSVENGQVNDVFQRRSVYQGRVTASTGFIVFDAPVSDEPDFRKEEIYAWDPDQERFDKIREIRNRVR